MQSLPIYLYQNNLAIILDLDPTIRGINQVMYQRDLKIQKGIKNNIRIQFKNSDQKLLNISQDQMFIFSIFDANTNRLVVDKPVTVLDNTVVLSPAVDQTATGNNLVFADTSNISQGQTVSGFGISANTIIGSISNGTVTLNNPTTYPISSSTSLTFCSYLLKGAGEVTFTESDTLDMTVGSYRYAIRVVDADGTYLPTYTNTYYGAAGTLELLDNVFPVLQPSQSISVFQKSYNAQTQLYEHKSRAIQSHPEYNSNTALHTVAYYFNNYHGTVTLQATLNNNPDYQDKFATLETRTYNGFTGIDYINFNGVYSYIQVMHVPATAPGESQNDNPAYYGSVDQLLYRY
jgi:hypothetical protein